MNDNMKWIVGAVVVIGLVVGGVVYRSRNHQVPGEERAAAVPAKPAPPVEPAVKYPLPESTTQEALPPLNESDGAMKNALEGLIGKQSVERFVIPDELVRHIVVTIDNLSTEKVAERQRPARPTPGTFAVGGSEDSPVLDLANYERYKPAVQLLRSVDTKLLVAAYLRYYPLLQEAYENLGHPPQYFDDRVIAVIDHLLSTPELQDPVALTQPGVQYQFADPKLESRSAGQKVLMRMGRDNAQAVKDKLRELRKELLAQKPGN